MKYKYIYTDKTKYFSTSKLKCASSFGFPIFLNYNILKDKISVHSYFLVN